VGFAAESPRVSQSPLQNWEDRIAGPTVYNTTRRNNWDPVSS